MGRKLEDNLLQFTFDPNRIKAFRLQLEVKRHRTKQKHFANSTLIIFLRNRSKARTQFPFTEEESELQSRMVKKKSSHKEQRASFLEDRLTAISQPSQDRELA